MDQRGRPPLTSPPWLPAPTAPLHQPCCHRRAVTCRLMKVISKKKKKKEWERKKWKVHWSCICELLWLAMQLFELTQGKKLKTSGEREVCVCRNMYYVSSYVQNKRWCVLSSSTIFLPEAWKYSLLLCFISFNSELFVLKYYNMDTISLSLLPQMCRTEYLLSCFHGNTNAYYKHYSLYWRFLLWWFWNGKQSYIEMQALFRKCSQ